MKDVFVKMIVILCNKMLIEDVRDPKINHRCSGFELEVPNPVENKVLKEQLLHPYHFQKVQELLPIDFKIGLAFCRFIQDQKIQNESFSKKSLFIDEASCIRSGVINIHNEHIYQNQLKINIWAVDNFIIGLIVPNRLNGNNDMHSNKTRYVVHGRWCALPYCSNCARTCS